MELLANFSMILSLGPIIQPGAYGYGRREGPWACDGVFDVAQLGGGQWAAGTRLARVMRLLRVIRVIRVFASCSKTSNRNSTLRKNQQSKIGKRINEMLVRSLILVVIALSLIFPMLSFDEIDNSRALAFSMLVKGRNYSTYPEMLSEYKYQGEHNADGPTTFIRGYMTLLKTVVHGEATLFAVDTPTDGGVPITGAVANACMSNKLDTFAGCPPNFGTSNGMSPPHGRGMDGIRCLAILSIPAGAQPGDPNVAYWDISHLNQCALTRPLPVAPRLHPRPSPSIRSIAQTSHSTPINRRRLCSPRDPISTPSPPHLHPISTPSPPHLHSAPHRRRLR